MDTSLVEALVRSQKLTMERVRGLVLVVAATSPGRLADLADCDDLDVPDPR